ncbi:bifunctional 4-hydroxy-2-oxoglutarate aldolase/2-dehydro-3-deoxy-phosphogluconate aldolase [Neobacillus cucumis]|uniref:2-dehydro-3-deoxyphosphogluconate aldolase n=1 Tax=Neobacillus cucumis TaxID=1740721 RepID=A0A2N5HJG8_9BACI|nr:bifunctional 4-hydroxy-2-oxoglutarate aldolase/2-dehydro-3-deoxy-phosphogluconate aldolase [Neobacillus cucumis]PLS05653.1 2-dehydro-3-deoxyphosphogluconate aldolase [Neobacillus cucumis]
MQKLLQKMKQEKVVSIIRCNSTNELDEVVSALYDGGIRFVEITMNTPNALQGIEMIRLKFPDMMVGAGTVLDTETARLAILSGASFLLAPTLNEGSMIMANRYNIPLIPGVLTPTEILRAYELGAQVVKVFPIRAFGPQYIKDIKGPMPYVNIMPVGGVDIHNAKEYLDHGSFALGIGSTLVNDRLIVEKNFTEIYNRAKKLVEAIR